MWARVGSTLLRLIPGGHDNRSNNPEPVSGVVAEASIFLSGRAADAFVCHGRAVPYWAWLNALAHRPPNALRTVATAYPWDSTLTSKTIAIADQLDLVSPDQASKIQASVLVPAELAALSHGRGSPDDVARCVQRQVAQLCRHRAARR